MVQCVNLAADSRRKPRGIAGRAHFQVHATDLIAQVSAIGLGQWDIEARPYSVAIAAKPAVPEGVTARSHPAREAVQYRLLAGRIQLVHHAKARCAVAAS